MKQFIYLTMLVIAASLTSCKFAGKAVSQLAASADTSTKMDEAATYQAVEASLAKLEPKWKVYRLSIGNEGIAQMCHNTFGSADAYLMDAEGNQIYQTVCPEVKAPSPASNDRVVFDQIPAIEFTAAKAMKNIEDCKALIPEEYKFLNLEDYIVSLNERKGFFEHDITINVQEVGKETLEANGVKADNDVYYSLHFTVYPDGKISCREFED